VATSTVFDLRSYSGKMLRGNAYIRLKSFDGLTASIKILQLSFIDIKE